MCASVYFMLRMDPYAHIHRKRMEKERERKDVVTALVLWMNGACSFFCKRREYFWFASSPNRFYRRFKRKKLRGSDALTSSPSFASSSTLLLKSLFCVQCLTSFLRWDSFHICQLVMWQWRYQVRHHFGPCFENCKTPFIFYCYKHFIQWLYICMLRASLWQFLKSN